jgi:phosphoribosylformylglycinamidine synthase PurS subunit
LVVAEVRIELKDGIADPEGRNTQKALELLGFSDVINVRSIKVFEISMEGPELDVKKRVEEMCKRLLANPVIHKYSIVIK